MRLIKRIIRAENDQIEQRKRDAEILEALDAAQLAISEYYNGDRAWAERWLLQALRGANYDK